MSDWVLPFHSISPPVSIRVPVPASARSVSAVKRKKLRAAYLEHLGLAPDALDTVIESKRTQKRRSASSPATSVVVPRGPKYDPADYVSFSQAREWAHGANLVQDGRYGEIWWQLARDQPWFPKDVVPPVPQNLYKDKWRGWKDFLGYGQVSEASAEPREEV